MRRYAELLLRRGHGRKPCDHDRPCRVASPNTSIRLGGVLTNLVVQHLPHPAAFIAETSLVECALQRRVAGSAPTTRLLPGGDPSTPATS